MNRFADGRILPKMVSRISDFDDIFFGFSDLTTPSDAGFIKYFRSDCGFSCFMLRTLLGYHLYQSILHRKARKCNFLSTTSVAKSMQGEKSIINYNKVFGNTRNSAGSDIAVSGNSSHSSHYPAWPASVRLQHVTLRPEWLNEFAASYGNCDRMRSVFLRGRL